MCIQNVVFIALALMPFGDWSNRNSEYKWSYAIPCLHLVPDLLTLLLNTK